MKADVVKAVEQAAPRADGKDAEEIIPMSKMVENLTFCIMNL